MELRLESLTRRFGAVTAVDQFSLTLTQGVYGLLGANGAGKTTLMRLICGILDPDQGEVHYKGIKIGLLGEEYRDALGYLPQDFYAYPDFTADEFLMYVAALKGLTKKRARQRTDAYLETVGLARVRDEKIKTFSGGMKQRLGVAQAMLNSPRLLILDEPTAGLDPKERVRFRNLISTFAKDRIVLLSTHIVSDIEHIASEVVVMKAGRLLHRGKPETITAEVDGYVWECVMPSNQVEQVTLQFDVSNVRNIEDGKTVVRIIAEEKPLPDANTVQPSLEDLYLFYFKEEEKK